MDYDREALREQLTRQEARMPTLYFDDLNILTGGVGHAFGHIGVSLEVRLAMEAPGVMDRPQSEDVIDLWLAQDLAVAERELRVLAGLRGVDFEHLTAARQQVLLNMAFNLGTTRLGDFVKMWGALAAGDWDRAAVEALDSKWAKQVGRRAVELADMLREG